MIVKNIDHLHNKTEIPTVCEHNKMLSKQFLLGSYNPSRADHETTVSSSTGTFKPTVQTLFDRDIALLLPNTAQKKHTHYKKGFSHLHTKAVEDYTNNHPHQIAQLNSTRNRR